jgi:1-Cys peroxiredoxin 6
MQGVIFSHPRDFTPVCTTELSEVQKFAPEFAKRNVKVLAVSCDNVASHNAWIPDIIAYSGCGSIDYPIIGDEKREFASLFGMLDPEFKDDLGMPLTVRSVFIINPDFKVALTITYPPPVGRNFVEVIRVIDGLQLVSKHSVATPVNWKAGEPTVILPNISSEDAVAKFPKGFKALELPSGKQYLRMTPDPRA